MVEEALRATETRLTQAIRVASLGTFEHNHVTDVIEYSPLMRKMMDFAEEEELTLQAVGEKIAAEDREAVIAAIRKAHDPAGDGSYAVEFRVKSRDGRGGYIQNFVGKNLTINDSPTFLGIELIDKGIQASDPILGDPDQWTQLSNIRFDHIRVNNVSCLLRAQGVPPSRPVDGFTLADIQGTCDRAITMANMKNVSLSDIKVTNYQGPLLTETHVEGTGLNDPN